MPGYTFGQTLNSGVKYIKVNRYDSGGLDQSNYLSQLQNITLTYPDRSPVTYPIVTIQEQANFFLYGITPGYNTSSRGDINDYSFLATSASSFSTSYLPLGNPGEFYNNRVLSYGNVNGNTLGGFTASSGIYTSPQTPNKYIQVRISGSATSSPSGPLFLFVANPNGATNGDGGVLVQTVSLTFASGDFDKTFYITSSMRLIETNNIGFGVVTGGSNTVTVSKFHVSMSLYNAAPFNGSSSLTIFDPSYLDFDYNDYNPLLDNAETPEPATFYMDVDYSQNPLTPVNFGLIISGTADRALVQDSNYNSYAWSNIRYNGVKVNSPDFNENSQDLSSYGALPAVEQNQTYIAYFDGVGGTGPELIDQTGYFIKYLVDSNGNISKPSPGNTTLLNLKDNFELGKTAIVESKNATQTLATLLGEHTITEIGTIVPILITETGSFPSDYLRTMSFAQVNSPVLVGTPDFTFTTQKTGDTNYPTGQINLWITASDAATPTDYNFTNILNNPLNYWDGTTGIYTFGQSTFTYNTDVSFQFNLAWYSRNLGYYDDYGSFEFYPQANIKMQIQLSTNGGSTWSALPITNVSTTNGVALAPNLGSIDSTNTYNLLINSGGTNYSGIKSIPKQFNNGDKIRFVFTSDSDNVGTYGTPNSLWTSVKSFTNYSSTMNVTSSYWDGATYPTNGNTPQYLTASLRLSNFLTSDFLQLTPTASLSMSFSQIIYPSNIQPGDYIRFEYDPSKQSKVYEVNTLNDGRNTIKIFPAVPTGSKLDHFVVWRVIDDGNYVTLDIKKPTSGSISGWLKPKYLSKELQTNFNDIVNKLETSGLIT
jgi:hypothetical protein